jgi:putative transposase
MNGDPYYLVWIPKYRKRILQGKIAHRLTELFSECVDLNDWQIEEFNIQKDHLHLLIRLRANISLSKVVRVLKGGSSKIIRNKFSELKEFLWGESFFWLMAILLKHPKRLI